jgi:hypothetical protein
MLRNLPLELLSKIAAYSTAAPGLYPTSTFISAKPPWSAIAGFATASRATRDIALRAWFRVLLLRGEEDWDVAAAFPMMRLSVREIYVHSGALSPTTSPDALLAFPALRAAHINAHNDVTFDLPTGYTYYTLLPSIPRGLKRLAIAHTHAPDAERLELLGGCADLQLEELRLGRCTLFDCATQGCSYWPAFPHDHDAYFSDDGAAEYASGIAHDLAPLKSLRTLHLGVYLTPYIALSKHQREHTAFMPTPAPTHVSLFPTAATHLHPPPPHHLHLLQHPHHRAPLHCPSLWASPCAACRDEFEPVTKLTEHAACRVLGDLMPGLKEVSWAGYFEQHGRGVSVWERGGEEWVKSQV